MNFIRNLSGWFGKSTAQIKDETDDLCPPNPCRFSDLYWMEHLEREARNPGFHVDSAEWDHFVPFSKDAAQDMLLKDLPKGAWVGLSFWSVGSGVLHLEYRPDRHQPREFTAVFPFHFEHGVFPEASITVQNQYSGIGSIIMNNADKFFWGCRVRRHDVFATYSAGGYAWARYGFVPDKNVSQGGFSTNVKFAVWQRFKALSEILTKDEKDELGQAVALSQKYALWDLADSQIDLGPRLTELFTRADKGSMIHQAILERVAQVDQYDDEDRALKYFRNTVEGPRPYRAGRFHLAGTSWHGSIDAKDERQVRRANDYVEPRRASRSILHANLVNG